MKMHTRLSDDRHRGKEDIHQKTLAAANAAYQKVQSGTDFVALAKEQNLSETDIDLGILSRAQLADPAIAEAAFNLELPKVAEPVPGKLGGVVLLRVTLIEPGRTPTYEEAKPELEQLAVDARGTPQQILRAHLPY